MNDSSLNPDLVRERLRTLYARHHGFVRKACWRYVQNNEDADDLAHEVLIKAARHYQSFDGACSATTWLYRVATNHCRDAVRSSLRRQEAHARFLLDPEVKMKLTLEPNDPFEDHYAETKGAAQVLEELRVHFEGPDRHILYLCFDVGMPQQGMAHVTGLNRASIARCLSRIRERACALYFEHRSMRGPAQSCTGSWIRVRPT
jgi:RNA polymerase sigma-70 factor (ECF subfamily)